MSKDAPRSTTVPTSLTGLTIASSYRLGRKIASGNFGELRIARSTGTSFSSTSTLYAVKLEPIKTKNPVLKKEYRYYDILSAYPGSPHIPSTHYYGSIAKYNCLVLDLLGPSLEDLLNICNRHFSLKTTCQIAIQLLSAFEYIHSRNIIHRDPKPENFLLGRPSTGNDRTIHVIDFGLSKEYIDPYTLTHIPFREDKNLTGTPRYMSINAHLNREQSRRDDLEALGHTLLYCLKGHLPWIGLYMPNMKERYRSIGEVKQSISVEKLCAGQPEEVAMYMRFVRGLKFEEEPDYGYLIGLWERILKRLRLEVDGEFDWTGKVMPTPVGSLQRVPQYREGEVKEKKKGMEVAPQVVEKGDKENGMKWGFHRRQNDKEKEREKDKKIDKLRKEKEEKKDKGGKGLREEPGKKEEGKDDKKGFWKRGWNVKGAR